MALRVFSALCGELEFSFVFALVFLFLEESEKIRNVIFTFTVLFFFEIRVFILLSFGTFFCLRFIFFALSLLFSSICKWRE